ncbi:translation initiation factor IF-2, partial [bacterium]
MPENSESSPKKEKVLDLLDTTKKPSRRERQRKEAEVVPPAPSALEQKKANALDLFSDDKKKTARKAASKTAKPVIAPISKILDQEEQLQPDRP